LLKRRDRREIDPELLPGRTPETPGRRASLRTDEQHRAARRAFLGKVLKDKVDRVAHVVLAHNKYSRFKKNPEAAA
jgi:hypothetical protein